MRNIPGSPHHHSSRTKELGNEANFPVLVGHLLCDIVLHVLLPHYLCVGVAATTDSITASSPGAEHAISSGSGQAVERGGGGVEGEGGGGVEGGGGGVEGEGSGGVEGEGGGGVEGEGGGVEGEGGGMTKRPSELHPERKRGMCVCVF